MEKKDKKNGSGKEVMVARLIYLEPTIWNYYEKLAAANGTTRSTEIRKELKRQRSGLQNNPGVEKEV